MKHRIQAFVSSPMNELAAERRAVKSALKEMEIDAWIFEHDSVARGDATAQGAWLEAIERSDLLIVLAWQRYGQRTVEEYEYATRIQIGRLVFEKPADNGGRDPELRRFLARIQDVERGILVGRFEDSTTLRHQVKEAVAAWLANLIQEKGRGLPPKAVNPHVLGRDFTGRFAERRALTNWWKDGEEPVFCHHEMGGMGKSALAWVWTRHDVAGLKVPMPPEKGGWDRYVPVALRPEGLFWYGFEAHDASFQDFLKRCLDYVKIEDGPSPAGSVPELAEALLDLLDRRRVLIVMDAVERLMTGYGPSEHVGGGTGQATAPTGHRLFKDPDVLDFLRQAATRLIKSRIMLTSRLAPEELREVAGCRSVPLTGLGREDGVALLRKRVRKGTQTELERVWESYGGHPLALVVLAGRIVNDVEDPAEIGLTQGLLEVVPGYLRGGDKKHVLEFATDNLSPDSLEVYQYVSVFREVCGKKALQGLNLMERERLDAALRDLSDRDLIQGDQRGFFMQPVIRRHAYSRIASPARLHRRVASYYERLPIPVRPRSIAKLRGAIECFYHMVRGDRLDAADALFEDELKERLYYQFGAFEEMIDLINMLWPPGEAEPRVKPVHYQNRLAIAYTRAGKPALAAERLGPLARFQNPNPALLVNLAEAQIRTGQLRLAEDNLIRSLASGDIDESGGHLLAARLDLAWLYALIGDPERTLVEWEEAKRLARRDGLGSHRVWRIHCQWLMMEGKADEALQSARKARRLLATGRRSEWHVLSIRHCLARAQSLVDPESGNASSDLEKILTQCRRKRFPELELQTLLSLAEQRLRLGELDRSVRLAAEAAKIANRGGYRLLEADSHILLAQAKGLGSPISLAHARNARHLSLCDPPSHQYARGLRLADILLSEAPESLK